MKWFVPWMFCVGLWLAPWSAHAQQVDVRDPGLSGRSIGPDVQALFDETERLTLADVLRPENAARFAPPEGGALRYGYRSSGALWVRFSAVNRSAETAPWYLEVGYPLLDYLTLYSADGHGGYARRDSGDKLAFSTRDLPLPNVVFALEEPAHGERTYYLRVQTRGVMLVPLWAFSEAGLLSRGNLVRALLFAFYGASLAIVLYHTWLFALTRLAEHGLFALAAITGCSGHFCHSGYAFQYLWPNDPDLAHRAVVPTMALGFLCNALFLRFHTHQDYVPRLIQRAVDAGVVYGTFLVGLALLLPDYRAAPVLGISIGTLMVVCVIATIYLRVKNVHPSASPDSFARGWVNMLVLGWGAIFVGLLLNNLMLAGHLPRNVLTGWGLEIGVLCQLVLVSTGLASRLKWIKAELAVANDELSLQVDALANAVQLADAETERSRAAARAKDELVATMTHELRTPLNAIINVPPGIVQNIVDDERVHCSACDSWFGLHPDERFDEGHACPECGRHGTLALRNVPVFAGDATQTLRHLALIERAGRHLLFVVRGILDPSAQLERTNLQLEEVDVASVLRDVTEELSVLASRSGVNVALDLPSAPLHVQADPDRLRQVLINLVGNALKFSDGHGTVTIGAGGRSDACVFHVRDQGIGIAREQQARIFESFEQTGEQSSRKFRGTGLGLSIARALVRLHGGTIWVESELGQGACFYFSLPRSARA